MVSETWIQIIGLVAGVCTAVSLLPQLIKIMREKRAEQLSLFYLFTLLLGLGLWIAYGVLRSDLPIILTNIASALLNVSVIVLSIKYRKPQS
ncbi:SemiSWEET family sugar transporter [Parachryseolinea silvisoli]|jgi:MtN3 and saliva related transmembrane protein|uniref:SemiSWEET family sugar transporter n=1 Tax=Parachryseolinea silvisoli TaxID=2873601 RepID=UPI002265E7B3|nr:SemiSWEET transporter [Parachryseolinea silvisoli]MCD9017406.1 SemiSWEET transporter [Parachryseolinea silvisoli]